VGLLALAGMTPNRVVAFVVAAVAGPVIWNRYTRRHYKEQYRRVADGGPAYRRSGCSGKVLALSSRWRPGPVVSLLGPRPGEAFRAESDGARNCDQECGEEGYDCENRPLAGMRGPRTLEG
jgi:hypothetical protein